MKSLWLGARGYDRADARFKHTADLETDPDFADAFFSFLQYLYAHRTSSLSDSLKEPTRKPAAGGGGGGGGGGAGPRRSNSRRGGK